MKLWMERKHFLNLVAKWFLKIRKNAELKLNGNRLHKGTRFSQLASSKLSSNLVTKQRFASLYFGCLVLIAYLVSIVFLFWPSGYPWDTYFHKFVTLVVLWTVRVGVDIVHERALDMFTLIQVLVALLSYRTISWLLTPYSWTNDQTDKRKKNLKAIIQTHPPNNKTRLVFHFCFILAHETKFLKLCHQI